MQHCALWPVKNCQVCNGLAICSAVIKVPPAFLANLGKARNFRCEKQQLTPALPPTGYTVRRNEIATSVVPGLGVLMARASWDP